MRHYCPASQPECFARYDDGDTPESVACDRLHCPARETLRIQHAVRTSTVHIPLLSREHAMQKGGRG